MKSILRRFLDSKGVPNDAVEDVVASKHYYAFHKGEFEHFERVVVWLGTVGLHSGEELGCVLRRYPSFLWTDINLLESKMQWFLSELGFRRHEIGPMMAKNPNLLYHHAEDLGHFLQLLESLGLDMRMITRMVKDDPMMIERCENVEELQSLIRWLTATLELDREQCGDMIIRVPALLNPVHHEDLPYLHEYLHRLGLNAQQVGTVLFRSPECSLRRLSVIRAMLHRLKRILGIRQGALAMMLMEHPRLLCLEMESIDRCLLFLTQRMGLLADHAQSSLKASPTLLLLDVHRNLLPRYLFLLKVLGCPQEEIVEYPESLVMPMEFVMQRFGFFEKYGMKDRRLKLKEMVQQTDHQFAEMMHQSDAKYAQFIHWWSVPSHWRQQLEAELERELFPETEAAENEVTHAPQQHILPDVSVDQ